MISAPPALSGATRPAPVRPGKTYQVPQPDAQRDLFGEEHPDIAQALINLAFLSYDAGDLDAIAVGRQALAIKVKVLGPSHPEVAATMADAWPGPWRNQGPERKPKDLLRNALQTHGTSCAELSHPEVARGRNRAYPACLHWTARPRRRCGHCRTGSPRWLQAPTVPITGWWRKWRRCSGADPDAGWAGWTRRKLCCKQAMGNWPGTRVRRYVRRPGAAGGSAVRLQTEAQRRQHWGRCSR
ncbi:tetratricopeptide repeat protein [Rhodoferax sp.]|uniref:tetratricopeptide repeat protein n=1 Tax=Rhodoferax sp. TaxID=50421 RepID=UPI003A1016FC